jgi:hypothetical protein
MRNLRPVSARWRLGPVGVFVCIDRHLLVICVKSQYLGSK